MLARRGVLAGIVAAMLVRSGPAEALPEPRDPRVERRYLPGPFGQIHVRVAAPANGRKPTQPPLLLLHQSPLSGRMFDRLLPLLSHSRLAIAVDTPGYGESDRPVERPSLPAYGDAILAAVTHVYGPEVDVAGYHTGAALAADMAARHPRSVRKLVLISVPHFSEERRTALLKQLGQKEPFKEDGTHLLSLWTGSYKVRPEGQTPEDVARIVAEKQRVGRFGEWALLSALEKDMAPALMRITQATLLLAPHDGLEDQTRSAAKLIRNARIEEMPRHAYGLFDAAPAEIASRILAFLER
jgi:pimeloyl-ACP methyl ester carboxylesterase